MRASLVAQMVKNLSAMWETWVWLLGWEDPLEEGMITHSSIFAWRTPRDRGAWWAIVHEVKKSQTWLKPLSTAHSAHYAVACVLSFIQLGPSNVCRSYTQIYKDASFSSPKNPSVGVHLASLLILYNFLLFILNNICCSLYGLALHTEHLILIL